MYIIIIYIYINIYIYTVYIISWKAQNTKFSGHFGKSHYDQFWGNMLFLPVMTKKRWSHGKTLIIFDPWQDDDHLSQRLYFQYFFPGAQTKPTLTLAADALLAPWNGFQVETWKGCKIRLAQMVSRLSRIKANRGVYNQMTLQPTCNLPVKKRCFCDD